MKGEKVYLRPNEPRDIKHIYDAINFTEIGPIMGILPSSFQNQAEWYKNSEKDKSKFIFAICSTENDQYLGNISFTNIDYINRHGIFSIFLIKNSSRGKGFGMEATQLLIEFVFERLNMNKIYLKTSEEYVEAIKIYKKLNFTQDGVLKAHEFSNGKYHDKLIFSLLRDSYNPPRKK